MVAGAVSSRAKFKRLSECLHTEAYERGTILMYLVVNSTPFLFFVGRSMLSGFESFLRCPLKVSCKCDSDWPTKILKSLMLQECAVIIPFGKHE
jgi:hypothetical protein